MVSLSNHAHFAGDNLERERVRFSTQRVRTTRARLCSGPTREPPCHIQRGGTLLAMMSWRRFIMFKRSQLYLGFALAALAEILIRVAVR